MFELLLDDWRTLLKKFHKSTVQHIFKEANQCVDALAKFGVNLLTMLILLTHQLWWRTYWLLTRLTFTVIDLFVINLYQHWYTQKKKNHNMSYLLWKLIWNKFSKKLL